MLPSWLIEAEETDKRDATPIKLAGSPASVLISVPLGFLTIVCVRLVWTQYINLMLESDLPGASVVVGARTSHYGLVLCSLGAFATYVMLEGVRRVSRAVGQGRAVYRRRGMPVSPQSLEVNTAPVTFAKPLSIKERPPSGLALQRRERLLLHCYLQGERF